MDLVASSEMEDESQILKKGQSVHHLFGWAGRCPFLPMCFVWKFIFESAHAFVQGSVPGVSHCNLCCIWSLNPNASQFVMA